MALPEGVINYLNENAESQGVATPQAEDDLFKSGILDSFSLVDFVSILETQFNIQISDSDVNPENFRSIEVIERYIDTRRGQDRGRRSSEVQAFLFPTACFQTKGFRRSLPLTRSGSLSRQESVDAPRLRKEHPPAGWLH